MVVHYLMYLSRNEICHLDSVALYIKCSVFFKIYFEFLKNEFVLPNLSSNVYNHFNFFFCGIFLKQAVWKYVGTLTRRSPFETVLKTQTFGRSRSRVWTGFFYVILCTAYSGFFYRVYLELCKLPLLSRITLCMRDDRAMLRV